MKTLYILIFGFVLAGINTNIAQNNMSDFTIQSSDFSLDGESTGVISTISKTDNTITWIQNNNENNLITVFTILDTSGSWNNTTSSGEIILTIQTAGVTSTLFISGDHNGISLEMETTEQNNASEVLSFEVTSIVYL